jgi:hypothetical protein
MGLITSRFTECREAHNDKYYIKKKRGSCNASYPKGTRRGLSFDYSCFQTAHKTGLLGTQPGAE